MRGAGVLVLLIAALTSGCSSSLKQYNPRMGLLDLFAQMEPANRSGEVAGTGYDDQQSGVVPVKKGFGLSGNGKAVAVSEVSLSKANLRWPLNDVRITSPFGNRGHEFHEGVDLAARIGTPVYAAHAGKVVYAGDRIRGYGRMIVLRSSLGIATVYGHNSRLMVRKGQWVSRGRLIAYSGSTGHSTGPHLHFEVREGISAVNPVLVLPRFDQPRIKLLAKREH